MGQKVNNDVPNVWQDDLGSCNAPVETEETDASQEPEETSGENLALKKLKQEAAVEACFLDPQSQARRSAADDGGLNNG